MKKLFTVCFVLAILAGTLITPAVAANKVTQASDTYHVDHRTTPKLQFEPQWSAPAGLSRDGVADAFIEFEGSKYQLSTDREDLEFLEVKESLLGLHYAYQQKIHGIAVDGGHFIVSVSKDDNRVYRVYNNTYPVAVLPGAPLGAINEDRAYDAAWQELRGHGELIAPASSKLVYSPVGDTFVLNYVIDLHLDAPYGGWKLVVDALDGVVTQIDDSRLIRKINPDMLTIEERLAEYNGAPTSRTDAFARYDEKLRAEELQFEKGSRAQGTGVVFDPDPRTTLNNNSLQDYSSASSFTAAYFTRDLLDINYSGGLYRVTGPWVNIQNWDPPSTAPSTTSDGNWTATRGDNSFNDAMTYFHLDQSQRYMQSLGFTGSTGIQEGSIMTDTDGVNGQDNSYYQPAANRLSFGHGCVDDDEDADVILHEYGHAIQHDIAYWNGGDTGAMGEGFGDYWAGSYSYSTPNGQTFYPHYIYTWDGHGPNNHCWPGRIMNAFGATYVHTTTYGAHTSIPGGFVSDELWSTPLFQSLVTLMDLGYNREDVDQIVLESHFGIGFGPKMREMGNVTIGVAEMLFPDGPHADVFTEKFLAHSIVEIPIVQLEAGALSLINPAGNNGVLDPGESVDFNLEVMNIGALDAGGVSAVVTTITPLVAITQGNSDYIDLPAGGGGTNSTPFSLSLDGDFPCGDEVELTLTFTYNNTRSVSAVDFVLGTGDPQGLSLVADANVAIPDANGNGVVHEIEVSGTGGVVTENFSVDVRIIHPFQGDLRVILISPAGTNVWLHNRSGGAFDNIIGNYPNELDPVSSFSLLYGQPLDGTWGLKVIDWTSGNTGTLERWGLNDVAGYECEDVVSAVEDEMVPVRFAMSQNHPNPFNPMTTISFAVPENAGVVQLAVYDISGRLVRHLESSSLAAGNYQRVWDGKDLSGRTVSSGTYFYRLSGRGFTEAKKMILMK